MTDNEIVKDLRSWLEEIRKARQAYLEKVNEVHYPSMWYEYLLSDTIHEITRLQAENKRLKETTKNMSAYVKGNNWGLVSFVEFCKNLKAEAYKEFAKRLKKVYADFDEKHEQIFYAQLITAIDCLLIGMVGGENGEEG